MSERTSEPGVTFQRGFADGRMLFERDGTYFMLTIVDVQQINHYAALYAAMQETPETPAMHRIDCSSQRRWPCDCGAAVARKS